VREIGVSLYNPRCTGQGRELSFERGTYDIDRMDEIMPDQQSV